MTGLGSKVLSVENKKKADQKEGVSDALGSAGGLQTLDERLTDVSVSQATYIAPLDIF